MALSPKIHIGWQNDLLSVVPTPDRPVSTGSPIAAMLTGKRGKPTVFQLGANTTLQLTGSSATEYTASALMIKGHTLPATATARLRLYEGAGHVGLVADTGSVSVASVIPWGELIAGITPHGSTYDTSGNLAPVFVLPLPAHTRWRSYIIDFDGLSGNISIDRMVLCFAWAPRHNYEVGAELAIVDASEIHRSKAGGVYEVRAPALRRMGIEFRIVDRGNAAVLMYIQERVGKGGELYIINDPTQTAGYLERLASGVYVRENDAALSRLTAGLNDLALSLMEC